MNDDAVEEMETFDSDYTLEEAIDFIGYGPFQRRLMLLTATTQVADAMELMLLPFLSLSIKDAHWQVSSVDMAWLSTAVFLGMLVGAHLTGLASDHLGRRFGVLATTACVAIFGVLSAVSPSFPVLLVTRGFVGVGVGGSHAAFSLYTEFLPAKARGKHLLGFLAFFSSGTVAEVLLAWLVLPLWGWRGLLLLSAVPSALVLVASSLYLPESPRFLAVSGRCDVADGLLRQAAAMNGVELPEGELHEPPRAHELSITGVVWQSQQRWREMMSKGLRQTTLSLSLLFFLMALLYYGLVLLTVAIVQEEQEQSEFSTQQFLRVFIANAAEFPGLFAAFLLLERIGRKKTLMLMFSCCGCFVFALLLPLSPITQTVLVFGSRACALAFNQSLWVYSTEVFPTSVRATALGMVSSFARIGGAMSPFLAQLLFVHSQSTTLMICGVCCLCAALLVLLLPRETQGVRLEDSVW